MANTVTKECNFQTDRLEIQGFESLVLNNTQSTQFAKNTMEILSPEVTKNLPSGWQNIHSVANAVDWINSRNEEGSFLVITHRQDKNIIGFLFLYESVDTSAPNEVWIGYLLSEKYWGQGIGSELISGLVNWCSTQKNINALIGGVEPSNKGSIRVLEKNGFSIAQSESQDDDQLFLVYRFE